MKFDHLLAGGTVLVGTPDRIIETIGLYEEVGVTQIITGTQVGGISQEQAMNSIRMFGEEVIPAFAERPAARQAN
jgi:alkanesulfonate monooxygenase SsuD/methylene tetrahydromethanopterin reductase-like flavin-dependent oxidoreductase (luciferase family)